MSEYCEFNGLHPEERMATIRAGWKCEVGHILIVNYCEECYSMVATAEFRPDVTCNPRRDNRTIPVCHAQVKILETVRAA